MISHCAYMFKKNKKPVHIYIYIYLYIGIKEAREILGAQRGTAEDEENQDQINHNSISSSRGCGPKLKKQIPGTILEISVQPTGTAQIRWETLKLPDLW